MLHLGVKTLFHSLENAPGCLLCGLCGSTHVLKMYLMSSGFSSLKGDMTLKCVGCSDEMCCVASVDQLMHSI